MATRSRIAQARRRCVEFNAGCKLVRGEQRDVMMNDARRQLRILLAKIGSDAEELHKRYVGPET